MTTTTPSIAYPDHSRTHSYISFIFAFTPVVLSYAFAASERDRSFLNDSENVSQAGNISACSRTSDAFFGSDSRVNPGRGVPDGSRKFSSVVVNTGHTGPLAGSVLYPIIPSLLMRLFRPCTTDSLTFEVLHSNSSLPVASD